MNKHTINLSRDSINKIEYLLQNTRADSMSSLVEILIDFSYNIVKKKGKLL
jgi:hypothetical protein